MMKHEGLLGRGGGDGEVADPTTSRRAAAHKAAKAGVERDSFGPGRRGKRRPIIIAQPPGIVGQAELVKRRLRRASLFRRSQAAETVEGRAKSLHGSQASLVALRQAL